MPLVLYGYILRELVKLLLLSGTVLTLVMSIGFMIKPVSEGTLGAATLVKLMLFVSPAMLTYALPIAAAFASTLVFFRMSADNEITACAVGGISYRSLLMPALVLGIGLTLVMFYAANFVIPGFWKRVELLAQQDIARVMVERLKRHEAVRVNEYVVYADDAEAIAPDEAGESSPESSPESAYESASEPRWYQRIVLWRPVVAKLDHQTQRVEGHYTGESAAADLYRHGGKIYAMIRLKNTEVSSEQSATRFTEQSRNIPAQEIPSFFESKPRYLALDRLRQMAAKPDLNSRVTDRADQLRHTMAIERLLADFQRKLSGAAGSRELDLYAGNRENYSLAAPIVEREGPRLRLEATDGQPVTVLVGPKLASRQTLEAESARLEVEITGPDESPRVYLRLDQVRVIDPRLPMPTEQTTVYLPPLRPADAVTQPLAAMDSFQLLRHASVTDKPAVHAQARLLADQIGQLRRRITSTVHERAAMAVCALLVLALGAVMSMSLRHHVPLVIFFWCFLPAIAAVFMINGGKNIVRAQGDVGAILHGLFIWSGNLFLVVVVWGVYTRLCRH